ncbi:helix-turn-helix domain-containing protein [Megasphaera sp.]|uniref:helix-turn-helix domain-containing protein n=1 Tax=Megasphaera sp. TaxID=2023260 RepID=UPI0027BAF31B|nr:helix-turn-helix domain-containing protein [Megasphaera sp.]
MLESKSYIATPPGATIKELLEDRGMTQKEFSKRMGMSEKHTSKLINGEVHLIPDMAEKLELVLGVPASFWNNLEAIYQEKLVKVKRENELEREKELAKKYPYNKIVQWGMVPSTRKWTEKIINLCKFFEVSRLELLQNKDLMPVACRKLSDSEKSTYIMRTLAQYAKLKARDMDTAPFSADALKRHLRMIRNLLVRQPMNFSADLAEILKSCGIALVYLPQVQGSFLHGISFCDPGGNKVVLGITMRGKYADRFWFSLFHEISHILEGHIYQKDGTSEEDEKQADRMAAEILIPLGKIEEFYLEGDYSIHSIEAFADAIQISPDIVIGRLQHDKKIRQNQLNQYKRKYEEAVG